MTGIKKVRVTVKRERGDGRFVEVSLSQMILDPAMPWQHVRQARHASADAARPPSTGGTSP